MKEQTKTLKGAFLLFCTGGSPKLLLLQLVLAIGLRISIMNVQWSDAALFIAVCCYWPFQEWFMHKTILHAKPRTLFAKQWDSPMAYVHRYHHRNLLQIIH